MHKGVITMTKSEIKLYAYWLYMKNTKGKTLKCD